LLLIAFILTPLRADDALVEAWRNLAGHLHIEAATQLKKTADSRERELAAAVLLALRQPTTDERLLEVERRLLALADGHEDDISAAALYLAGRLYQVHFNPSNPAKAAQYYEQLAARAPDSHWAQLGLVKLGLLQLYVLPVTGGPSARLATAAALLPRVTIPALRRDLLITLARTRIFYEQPLDAVLADFLAADAIGGLRGPAQGDVYLQIGELSFRAGRLQQSRDYFQRYLNLNSADPRSYTAQQRLDEIATRLAAGGEEQS
jgi:hypothetical protein